MNGTAINIEMNMIVFNLDKRDMRGIARLYRGPVESKSLSQFRPTGSSLTIFQLQKSRIISRRVCLDMRGAFAGIGGAGVCEIVDGELATDAGTDD